MKRDPFGDAPADLIPDERARQALRRAAELQAEAVSRLQKSPHTPLSLESGTSGDGFRRGDVEAAAVEAGIAPEYIRQALVEQEALGEHAEELAPWVEGMGRRVLGSEVRTLQVSRVMDADPPRVLEAMRRIFPAHPYSLTLEDSIGGPPLEGGVLVFQVPRPLLTAATGYTPFSYATRTVDLLQLHATLRAVPGAGAEPRCELTLRGDLRTGTRRNVWGAIAMAGAGGVFGGVVATAVVLASGAILPVALAAITGSVATMGGASGVGYGALYRHYLRKTVDELERLLKVVDASARTGGAFRPPNPDPPLANGGDVTGMMLNSGF